MKHPSECIYHITNNKYDMRGHLLFVHYQDYTTLFTRDSYINFILPVHFILNI